MPATDQDNLPKIGVLTVSDRASRGEYEDRGGPAAINYLRKTLSTPVSFCSEVIPDIQSEIETAIIEMTDQQNCSLVVITGGTGPTIRDVTPEALEKVCDKMLPGIRRSHARGFAAKSSNSDLVTTISRHSLPCQRRESRDYSAR